MKSDLTNACELAYIWRRCRLVVSCVTYYGPLKKKMTPGCGDNRSAESMLIGASGNTSRQTRGCLSTVKLVSSNCQHVMPCRTTAYHQQQYWQC